MSQTWAGLEVTAAAALLRRKEKHELADIASLASQLSMVVCSTQQYRESRQHIGLADLWIFDPLHAKAFWWEGKAVNGTQTVDQQDFQVLAARCYVPYGIGTFADFLAWLHDWRGLVIAAPADCERWSGKREAR